MSILDLTLAVTEFIQGREIDMADVSYLLDFLKSVILSKRNNVNEFHNNCHGIILEVPRVISINETEARTATFPKVKTMFLRNQEKVATIPLLDHLLTQSILSRAGFLGFKYGRGGWN